MAQLAEQPATPAPTPTVIVPEGQQAPAVTEAQAERILARIAATRRRRRPRWMRPWPRRASTARRSPSAQTNYTLRAAIADYAALAAIPTKPLEIVLPQAYDGWPRSVMAVVDDEARQDRRASC